MNDYSSNLQEGMWWNTTPTTTPKSSSQSQQNAWGAHWLGTLNTLNTPQSAASAYRIYHPKDEHSSSVTEEDDEEMELHPQQPQEQEMEHMFEKPLTPSDVGKLNRLVIPKQHAEKYFPLSRVDSVEKGLLLSFEDESGKLWRFRYSYWNSSQSYVLTKGWSRFVKEKQLDAGDVVSFERRRPDGEQLYIRWRRRVTPPVHDSRLSQSVTAAAAPSPTTTTTTTNPTSNTSSAWTRVYYSTHHPYPSHHLHGPLLYQPDCLHAAEPILQNPARKAAGTTKKQVRLFGVNLDCQLDEPEPPGPADVLSYSNQNQAHFLYSHGHDLNHHIQQDSNFSREYYHQMRNYPPGGSGDMPI